MVPSLWKWNPNFLFGQQPLYKWGSHSCCTRPMSPTSLTFLNQATHTLISHAVPLTWKGCVCRGRGGFSQVCASLTLGWWHITSSERLSLTTHVYTAFSSISLLSFSSHFLTPLDLWCICFLMRPLSCLPFCLVNALDQGLVYLSSVWNSAWNIVATLFYFFKFNWISCKFS